MLGFTGCFGVDVVGKSGGLLLFWNNEINVSLRSYSVGHIDYMVCFSDICWHFTRIYGNLIPHLRRFSWDLLRKLQAVPHVGSSAWLVGGDFNELFFSLKKEVVLPIQLNK